MGIYKLKIRFVSIPHCIKKKNNLLKEINLLETELERNSSASNLDRFNVSKIDLEQIEKHETQVNILRTKISLAEHGEKTQSYF